PAVWLLGALSPGLVAAAVAAGAPVGKAAGGVAAAGTAGSLCGTFAATHWLVPAFGCRATLWGCALVLVARALLLRAGRRAVAAGVAVLLSLLLQQGPLRCAADDQELLAERESALQYLQVVRTRSGGGGARTELKINEGLDSFHSVELTEQRAGDVVPRAFTDGGYYDYHAIAPLLGGDGARPAGLRVLSLGDAAGTFRRIYAAVHPGAVVDAVELDPAASALGDDSRLFVGRKA